MKKKTTKNYSNIQKYINPKIKEQKKRKKWNNSSLNLCYGLLDASLNMNNSKKPKIIYINKNVPIYRFKSY